MSRSFTLLIALSVASFSVGNAAEPEYGGGYYTHMRNAGDRLLEAIDETLDIGRQASTPVHLFHLNAAGKQNWGKMPLAIATIRAA
ncbi:D-aminoacylase [Stieleria neptunia]|uniref:D-aminoacylase n=1 Tax=Stieleria neptunia TaxID=2527979 RepID=A0A518HT97_9BACT|nr:hypothetical protein [Stieleria neptunia]QDV44089.1 D-aminoacylase [Stieleria neptunia]